MKLRRGRQKGSAVKPSLGHWEAYVDGIGCTLPISLESQN